MKTEYRIVMYATEKSGEGRVMRIGEYDDIDEITILTGLFSNDVQITFGYEKTTRNSDTETVRK